jgi:hypothetical protein
MPVPPEVVTAPAPDGEVMVTLPLGLPATEIESEMSNPLPLGCTVQLMLAVLLPVQPWSVTVVGLSGVVLPTGNQFVTGLAKGQSGPPPTTAEMNASAGGAALPSPPLPLPLQLPELPPLLLPDPDPPPFPSELPPSELLRLVDPPHAVPRGAEATMTTELTPIQRLSMPHILTPSAHPGFGGRDRVRVVRRGRGARDVPPCPLCPSSCNAWSARDTPGNGYGTGRAGSRETVARSCCATPSSDPFALQSSRNHNAKPPALAA